jgi:L-ascorbate metabolism protein UlaG (beta-lactamase superfamily)
MTTSVTFIGNATTILRLGAFTVLTDPNFLRRGQRAYLGYGLTTRRLTEPALGVGDLPPLDAVLLSHLHGDHWDRVATKGLDRSTPVVTTPHAAKRLRRSGFETTGLETWDTHGLQRDGEDLWIQALPGIHARGVLGAMLPPVMGSLVEHRAGGRALRLYITGDTLTGDHIDEIAVRHPDIDVALIHLGGTRVLMWTVTMDGAQGVDCLRRAHPRTAVPIHYDDYDRFASPLSDFLGRKHEAPATEIRTVTRGETVSLQPHPAP